MMEELMHCRLCPRECRVNRLTGQKGYCRSDAEIRIGSICIHHGEEPAISGESGICNVFFCNCNLQCLYCQNYQISRNREDVTGTAMTVQAVTNAIISCLDKGIEAVGFVSPTHYLPHVKEIIHALHNQGYFPVTVYNTNSYDKVECIRDLEGLIDVYLPDMKYMDAQLAYDFSGAMDYPGVATMAIGEMYRQKGSSLVCNKSGQALNGMIIRHLVLPGQWMDSIGILRWIAEELSPSVHISLMSQYYPTVWVKDHAILGRKVPISEYNRVVDAMHDLGFNNGWVQAPDSADAYNPDFSKDFPFDRES